MEIVGIDVDDRADGNGKAGLTWISKDLLKTRRRYHSSMTCGTGWVDSELRTYLNDTIYSIIPDVIKTAIIPVTKTSVISSDGSTIVTTDALWIPGYREVGGQSTKYEQTGPAYTNKFVASADRKKTLLGVYNEWWLRSLYNSSNALTVGTTGTPGMNSSIYSSTKGVALGFCTN